MPRPLREYDRSMSLGPSLFRAFTSRSQPADTNIVRQDCANDGRRLREALAGTTAAELSVEQVNTLFEGNLSMLTREAFLYYLPALMHLSLTHYRSVSVFASELVGALTKPSRDDIVASLDTLEQRPSHAATAQLLRDEQLAWFDSGTPTAIFAERFDGLAVTEGRSVLAFLEAFRTAHGADFPFDELDAAIDRYWARFRH